MIVPIDENALVEKKKLKTFSIHETNLDIVKYIKDYLFKYKHLENILNILLQQQFELNQTLLDDSLVLGKEAFNLLLNPVIMKAVLSNNLGGEKTKANISKLNSYFNHNNLFNQAILASTNLNDKNISMIVRRLKKDWSNFFSTLKDYNSTPNAFKGKPSYPQAKKLSKVFNYSVPLESDKFSLKKSGYLGINLGKKMFFVYIGKTFYFKDKIVNNVTVSYSHGHIYYNFTYYYKDNINHNVANNNLTLSNIKE